MAGLFQACKNLWLPVQKIIDPPFIYNKNEDKMIVNPKFYIKPQKLSDFRIKWYLGLAGVTGIHIYAFLHLVELFKQLKATGSLDQAEEILTYIFVLLMTAAANVSWATCERAPVTASLLLNNLFKRAGSGYQGWPNQRRLPNFGELFGYGIALATGLFPFMTGLFPWFRSYEPFSRGLAHILPEIPKKMCASLCTAVLTGWGAALVTIFIIEVVAGSVILMDIAKRNLKVSQEEAERIKSTRNKSKLFTERLQVHQELCLLTQLCNELLFLFAPTLQGIAIVFFVSANYVVVILWEKMNMDPIFPAFFIITSFGGTALNLAVLDYGSQPNSLSEELIFFWKKQKLGQIEKRQVKAMRLASLTLGNFFTVKKQSGMDVLDDVMQYTANAVTIK